MLVSLFTRMNAISQMYSAQYALMQNSMLTRRLCHSIGFGSGGYDMATLANLDRQIAMSNEQNQIDYQLAAAQKKFADQMISQELENKKTAFSIWLNNK